MEKINQEWVAIEWLPIMVPKNQTSGSFQKQVPVLASTSGGASQKGYCYYLEICGVDAAFFLLATTSVLPSKTRDRSVFVPRVRGFFVLFVVWQFLLATTSEFSSKTRDRSVQFVPRVRAFA